VTLPPTTVAQAVCALEMVVVGVLVTAQQQVSQAELFGTCAYLTVRRWNVHLLPTPNLISALKVGSPDPAR
jgi:hypothetical protein